MIIRLFVLLCLFQADILIALEKGRSCFLEAAEYHKVDPWLLLAIAENESSFNPRPEDNVNRDGSRDVGLMQINSLWFPVLKKKYGITVGDLYKPCVNLFVGAWILKGSLTIHKDKMHGIGGYNAGHRKTKLRSKLRLAYARRVIRSYNRLRRMHGDRFPGEKPGKNSLRKGVPDE